MIFIRPCRICQGISASPGGTPAGSGTGIEKLLLEGQNQNLLDGSDTDDNSTSYFLKNAIREAIDEFGDSLDTKEKVAVLARVLAELVAGENT